jgi:hypothetical protein
VIRQSAEASLRNKIGDIGLDVDATQCQDPARLPQGICGFSKNKKTRWIAPAGWDYLWRPALL